ncbi:hypothetical protein RhiJN_25818 [Ceratobasidium sp. AG-Ba]|nr:hypothetical protein RhiJN_24224 [Ceratobasidium sp. AG-Ba]QRV97799.1 hypothetical protein RhiJN_25818 [Ceratobasidium sp. AG-Ba]
MDDQAEADPGPQTADSNAPLSKEDVKYWKGKAQIAGRRVAAMYAPFFDTESLADQRVESHMDEILDQAQKAHESDNDLDDEVNPSFAWDTPRFDIPDNIDMVRELIFNLPKSPGRHWMDEFFQDAINLGVRKMRGDFVHAIAKNGGKIFEVHDSRFEDRAKRPDIPEVQELLGSFMHTKPDDSLDIFFKDECIVRTLRLLLNGPSAIRTGRRSAKSRKAHVDMWHVKFITPSLLAFAATAIKFVLSGEPSFEEASGSVNYTKWFLARLGLLQGLYHDHPDTYNDLIDYYNRNVLPDRYREVQFEANQGENEPAHDYTEGMNDEECEFLARLQNSESNE